MKSDMQANGDASAAYAHWIKTEPECGAQQCMGTMMFFAKKGRLHSDLTEIPCRRDAMHLETVHFMVIVALQYTTGTYEIGRRFVS